MNRRTAILTSLSSLGSALLGLTWLSRRDVNAADSATSHASGGHSMLAPQSSVTSSETLEQDMPQQEQQQQQEPDHQPANAAVTIGHTHLHVRDLERSVAFYRDIFDMPIREIVAGRFAFLSSTQRHHELALQAIGMAADEPRQHTVGLYHVAFEAPNAKRFAALYRRLKARNIAFNAIDHGISWALYFDDPDGNGLELYIDRRQAAEGKPLWGGRSNPLTEHEIQQAALIE